MMRTQVVSVYLDHTNRLTFKRASCIKLNTLEFICMVILQSHGAVTGVGQGCETTQKKTTAGSFGVSLVINLFISGAHHLVNH